MRELPEGWIKCPLRNFAKVQNGYAFPSTAFQTAGVPLIRQGNLRGDRVSLEHCVYLDLEWLRLKSAFVLHKGDLLIGMSGSIGKVCTYDLDIPALQNQRTGKVFPLSTTADTRFLHHYLMTVEQQLISKGKGMGVLNVSAEDIESLPFNIAPLAEQRRIVAKLDALLNRVNACRQRLDKIPKLLARFRQSVLAAACSGRLTEDWRTVNDSAEWTELMLADVTLDKPQNGYSPRPVKHETSFKVLTLTATTSGKFDPAQFKFFEGDSLSCGQFWLQPNDILIQRGNTIEYVGVPAIYDGPADQFIFPDLMMRVRANSKIITKYLYLSLSSRRMRTFLRERATGTAGSMPKINQPTLMAVPVPLPPLPEQQEIVRRVDQLFAFADRLEARMEIARKRVDALTQSILAKAFRGELVPTEAELARAEGRSYESAAQLLERIASLNHRGPAQQTRRPRKRKPRDTDPCNS